MAALDTHLRSYDVNEIHAIALVVSPQTALRRVLALEVGSDPLVRALFRLRGLRATDLPIERFARDVLGLAVVERSSTRFVAIGDVRGIRIGVSFEAEAAAGGSRLFTETRVAGGGRRFRLYWLVVGPFSALIRRRWLRAVARVREELPD